MLPHKMEVQCFTAFGQTAITERTWTVEFTVAVPD